jgi:hypothetical protein
MNAPDPQVTLPTISYRCSSCARCYIALDEEAATQILCACGAPLSAGPLPRGIYELRSPVSIDARATNPGRPPVPKESDLGYGALHGYGPAHGGPSGPGDAPASRG